MHDHPLPTQTKSYHGFVIEYFVQDAMAVSSIERDIAWEPHIVEFVCRESSIRNIIDIGANFGYHTLHFAETVKHRDGQVFAFEPQPQNFGLLERNVCLHNGVTNVVLYQKACAESDGCADISIVSSLVSESEDVTDVGYVNMGDFTLNRTHNAENLVATTECVALDSIDFPPIDLIKIDVQGWEVQVLRGAMQLLGTHRPYIIIELEEYQLQRVGRTCRDVIDTLHDLDYEIYFLEYSYPSDHLCVHRSKVLEFEDRFRDVIHPHKENNYVNHNVDLGICKKVCLV